MPTRIEVLKGATFAINFQYREGGAVAALPARYTQCKFQVRDSADETSTLLLSATESSGITINHAAGLISVSIGATQTELIPVTDRPRVVRGQLRVYDPTNFEDVPAWPLFDVVLLPEVIND